jgi:uncharacterized protein (TIGR03118 family)
MDTKNVMLRRVMLIAAAMVVAGASAQCVLADGANSFSQTNLVSDIPGMAAVTDPNLVNPWGMSSGPTSPIWVSDNGAGVSTLYTGAGTKLGLTVTIPDSGGPSAPTGQVFNSSSAFNGDLFIFASEHGIISGWRGSLGTTAEILSNQSGAEAVYKGLAIATVGSNTYLYAADFHNNMITVIPSTGAPALSGNFVDPNLPAGYAPFNIQSINGMLYVTYALQDASKHDDVSGAGHGFVDVFNLQGVLQTRLITKGALNSPWGLAVAPGGFGSFGGDLLVGNFGDGAINAYDPLTGAWMGELMDSSGTAPLVNQGLWGLKFGNGGNGGNLDELFFTAGIPGDGEVEDHGLFGVIKAPEPGVLGLLGSGLLGLIGYARRRRGLIQTV